MILFRMVKKSLLTFLCIALYTSTFAAIVSDEDGPAFVTKSEFESLKSNLERQVERYNTAIDNKIDGAIARYLDGIVYDKNYKLTNMYDKLNCLKTIYWSSNSNFGSNNNTITYFQQDIYYRNMSKYHFGGRRWNYKPDANKMVATTWKYDTTKAAYVEAMYKITPRLLIFNDDVHPYDTTTAAGNATFDVPTQMTLGSKYAYHFVRNFNATEQHEFTFTVIDVSTIIEQNYVYYAPNSTASEKTYIKYNSQSNLYSGTATLNFTSGSTIGYSGITKSKADVSSGEVAVRSIYPVELNNHSVVIRDKIFKPFYDMYPEFVSTIKRGVPICLVEHEGTLKLRFKPSLAGSWKVYMINKGDSTFTEIRQKNGTTTSSNKEVNVEFDEVFKNEVAYIIYLPTSTSSTGTIKFDDDFGVINIGR